MATVLDHRATGSASEASAHVPSVYDARALRDILARRTFKRGRYELSSGRISRIYFDLKATMMTPQGAAECARGLLAKLDGLGADYVGGLEMGAVPLLGTVTAFSWQQGDPVGAIFVRKRPKPHGTALMIEGLDEQNGETLAGKCVVLIDDVATTGESILKAVEQIETAGGVVRDAIVILDRQEGAGVRLGLRGIKLHALFTSAELGVTEADRQPIE